LAKIVVFATVSVSAVSSSASISLPRRTPVTVSPTSRQTFPATTSLSRLFLQQTIGLGGERVEKTSDPMQLATVVDSRRLVFTVGNFSVLDIFDWNNVEGDLRQTFFNEAFMTHASLDFPADSRGYTYGASAELYLDDWAPRDWPVRAAREPQ
jgi:high affinity Mn2+ porin